MSGAVWSWSTGGHSRPYDAEVSRLIEEGFCKNQQEVRIRLWTGAGHESYRVNFHKMRASVTVTSGGLRSALRCSRPW
ncbi:unnamed protein product [Effrenium voratum]|uniref:WWE domain-containing protein n=1 Tax=Effrenium voratum TaxID=2562239 RepID=A0AA36J1H1_9DINO|nr:unnamed protein product [Effrenium voratum]